ncbi:MAG: glycosyltransferase [Pseudonocardiales bacterium]|nr:glycosyltransferase [Pseudonocardiales bacterium]
MNRCDITVSLVLLTFNRWDCTIRLLDSLSADADGYSDVELVWIDNNSTDRTKCEFDSWLASHERLFGGLVRRFNDTNHGFVVGVNEATSLASGRYICLINSDAQVTSGWRHALLRALHEPGVAAAGPVSDGMPWNQSMEHSGQGIKQVPVVYGFCLMAPRWIFDQVGLLDERYGRGVIEIEDWCERAARAGMGFAVNTDVVVNHNEPHASYTPRVNGMLHIRNRQLFERKWGIGPWYWGNRDLPPLQYARTVVRVAADGVLDDRWLRGELGTLGGDTELLMVVRHCDDGNHLGWVGLARREPRLNVVCVPFNWHESQLPSVCRANSRGVSIEILA